MPYAHGFLAHRVAYFLRKCRVPLIDGYTRGGCRGRRPSAKTPGPCSLLLHTSRTNATTGSPSIVWPRERSERGQTIDGNLVPCGTPLGSMTQSRTWAWRLRQMDGVASSRRESTQRCGAREIEAEKKHRGAPKTHGRMAQCVLLSTRKLKIQRQGRRRMMPGTRN